MVRQPVQSSNLKSVGHDPQNNELEVEFGSGRVYRYSDVNVDEYAAMLGAQSIGSHFANIIKPVKRATVVFTDPVTGANANGAS
jgi:hypothetical protein